MGAFWIEPQVNTKFEKSNPDVLQIEEPGWRSKYVRNRWKFTCLFVAAAQLASATVAQHVLTESVNISGIHAIGLSIYKGIPFAAPPVGDLRWRPPVHAAPWTGTRKADAFAPACMQVGVSMPGETPPAVSEDCLYLNIWTPAKTAHEYLPVIVWIYGGGYINGSARSARVGRCASACGIGRGANVIFDFIGVFANDNTRQQNRQGEKTANGCKITIDLHFSPHSMNIRDRKPGKA